MQRLAELVERERLHVKLEIRRGLASGRAREGAHLRWRHGHRPAPAQQVIERHGALPASDAYVQRRQARDLEDQAKLQMVVEVFADARLVEHDRNAVRVSSAAGPIPDNISRCGEPIAPGGKDHFARQRASRNAVLPQRTPVARCRRTDALDQAPGFERQILAAEHRFQESARRRPAPAASSGSPGNSRCPRCRRG